MASGQKEKKHLSRGQLLFCGASVLALVLSFVYSSEAIDAMGEGMRLCVRTVIPSLFPFMVLGEVFVRSGAPELFGRYVGRVLSVPLGLSPEGSSAWLIGILFGFPVGTRSALTLYREGRVSRGELIRLCMLCNNPSSAFLINAVGISLFGSQRLGVLLYASHLICSLLLGVALTLSFGSSARRGMGEHPLTALSAKHRSGGALSSIADAVTGSAQSMLYICAFVVFFGAFIAILRRATDRLCLPPLAEVLILGFFEMTSGVSAAASLPRSLAIAAVAAITGWSGMSVCFQFVGLCSDERLPLYPYLTAKALCAALNVGITLLLVRVFGSGIGEMSGGSVGSWLVLESDAMSLFSLALFISSALFYILHRAKK